MVESGVGRWWTAMLAAAAMAAAPAAVAQDVDWAADVAAQAAVEIDCDVAFLSNIEERIEDGRTVIDVKVNCTDGRAFDARRNDPSEPFTFTRCEESKLKTC